ncbi:Abi family protein [Olsenella uli]|nr:Abi family protein [Olsenella uli]
MSKPVWPLNDAHWRVFFYLDAIERIEVYFRTQLAYELAGATGPFGFLDSKNLPRLTKEDYEEFLERCESEFERSSLLPFTSESSTAMFTASLRIGFS